MFRLIGWFLLLSGCGPGDPWIGEWSNEWQIASVQSDASIVPANCEKVRFSLHIDKDGTYEINYEPIHLQVLECRVVDQVNAWTESGVWSTFTLTDEVPVIAFQTTLTVTQVPQRTEFETAPEYDETTSESWQYVAWGETNEEAWIWLSEYGQLWEAE